MNIDEFIALKYYLSQIAQEIKAYSYRDVIKKDDTTVTVRAGTIESSGID